MSLNAHPTDSDGSAIHVGLLDSLGVPPEDLRGDSNLAGVYDDYFASCGPGYSGHGTTVYNLLTGTAAAVSISTFRVLRYESAGSDLPRGPVSIVTDGVFDAVEAGVDLLNLSLGIPDHDCGGQCPLSRQVRMATEEHDIGVLVSTGNQDETEERVGVCCPAQLESVISVGGYLAYCTADVDRSEHSEQWWIDDEERVIGPFCGQRSCTPDGSCAENRNEIGWSGNVSFHNCAPDVMAPVIEVHGSSPSEVGYQLGTSFGTPLVTGLVAGILGDLAADGNAPSANEVHDAVKFGSTPISGGYYKFDMGGTWKYLDEDRSLSRNP